MANKYLYLYSEAIYSYFIKNTIMFWDLISQPRPIRRIKYKRGKGIEDALQRLQQAIQSLYSKERDCMK